MSVKNKNDIHPGETPEKTPVEIDPDIKLAMEGVLTERQQKLIEEIDIEASTRKLSGPVLRKAFYWLCIAVSLYHFVTALIGTPVVLKHRSLHVGMMLVMSFVMYPFSKKSDYKKISWADWALIAASILIPVYMWRDYLGVVDRAGNANTYDMIAATLMVVLVIEASRRMSGWTLPILSGIFIAYGLWGRNLWGLFRHRGYTWIQLSNQLMLTEGILGSSVSVAASYIFLFILFGAVMGKTGMGAFFNDIAMALAGHTKGGPAKVSVISSGLLGSINGSAVANVVTTGAFTIPLMKKTGYSKEFAGAVEASASVGGQLLPPVMGAAAFIMAETLSVPYSKIIVHAAIPALMYYLGIIIQVHLRAGKMGLLGLPREQLPKVGAVLKSKGYLLIPILLLLYMLLLSGTTVIYSAVVTIIATLVIAALASLLKWVVSESDDGLKAAMKRGTVLADFLKMSRHGFKLLLDSFDEGARGTVSVAVACACVGIIVGVMSKTGFGLKMADAIISIGKSSLLLTLVFSMVTCMILGMGIPSIPAYIITATIAARALVKLGVPEISAHMFTFYFAMFANLTPPVALAAFAAAGLSGGNPMKTGFAAVKLAIAGFVVPYMFVYSPQLLLIDTSLAEGLRVAAGACVGVFMIAVAVEGYLFTPMNVILRVISFTAAMCLIDSGIKSDVFGILLTVALVAFQYFSAHRSSGGLADAEV
ncbi:MAG: TRAP transporter permease [Synergistaceae bacterium]|jgi:TRAP transporter 4TM/12TM fusion protein|nr:TRAP transporter permease [Synergistaceae bacterium]